MKDEDCVDPKRVEEDMAVDGKAPVEEEMAHAEAEGARRRVPQRQNLHQSRNKNQLTQPIIVIE